MPQRVLALALAAVLLTAALVGCERGERPSGWTEQEGTEFFTAGD